MASSNVFEHSRPMSNRNGLHTFAGLAVPHHGRRPGLAADADEGESFEPRSWPGECERVRAVRVVASRRCEDLLFRLDHDGLRLPAVVVFDLGHERGVDVVVLAQPDQQRRDEAAVLAVLVDGRVGGACEVELAPDAGHLVGSRTGRTGACRPRVPRRGSGARTGAGGAVAAGAEPVDAVVEAQFVLEVERDVLCPLRARSRSRRADR